jgi:fucose permease
MADITTAYNRTKRMAVLDHLKFVEIAIGFVSGGIIKAMFGWTPLYLNSMALIVIDILCYVMLCSLSMKAESQSRVWWKCHQLDVLQKSVQC